MKRLLIFLCCVIVVAICVTGVYAYLHGGDPEDPRRMEGRAMLGEAESQFKLAQKYSIGDGVTEDVDSALKWYRKAAEKGHPKAAMNMSRLYFTGNGVEQDDVRGAEWMLRAASAGDSYAAALMGMLYLGGIGVEQDPQMALDWLNRSEEPEAVTLSGTIAAELAAIKQLPEIVRKGRMASYFGEKQEAIDRLFRRAIQKIQDKEQQREEQGEEDNGH